MADCNPNSGCCGDVPCTPEATTLNEVSEYYGKVLEKSEDLKTNACCDVEKPPKIIRDILGEIHDEVLSKYYGCGLTIPKDFSNLKGLRILDLGSGSGRDCYILSRLVGESGHVVGVDMTDEQLEVARRHIDYHTKKFGYKSPNVSFLKGNIENLNELGLEPGTFDVIVSNCVINLTPDKEAVLAQVYNLLRKGGEMYFADVYADRRIEENLRKNKVLWGECLSGAMYWNDFIRLAKKVGFTDPRLVEDKVITISNEDVESLVGHIKFFSATYRLFKLDGLESDCEDYGQAVVYNGGIVSMPQIFKLDIEHSIESGRVFPVCGNTLKMLTDTRFGSYFTVLGEGKVHLGIYAGCGKNIPFASAYSNSNEKGAGGSCC